LALAKCTYCGEWTGVFGNEHAECRARYDRAISLIPGFFGKLMDSPTPPDKFVELLQQAASASFIDQGRLRDISKASMDTIIDWIATERCATVAEAHRLVDIADALEKAFPGGLDLNETVTKILMLAELSTGLIPEYVSISGQVPIDFGPGESGLWIFSQVDAWWTEPTEESGAIRFERSKEAPGFYVTRKPADFPHIRTPEGKPRRGDVLLTNRKMYFVRNEAKYVAVPIAQIYSLTPYADGISLIYNPRKPRGAIFRLDDPWFAANLVVGLVLRMPSVVG
jgi:hypothetical protein